MLPIGPQWDQARSFGETAQKQVGQLVDGPMVPTAERSPFGDFVLNMQPPEPCAPVLFTEAIPGPIFARIKHEIDRNASRDLLRLAMAKCQHIAHEPSLQLVESVFVELAGIPHTAPAIQLFKRSELTLQRNIAEVVALELMANYQLEEAARRMRLIGGKLESLVVDSQRIHWLGIAWHFRALNEYATGRTTEPRIGYWS